MENIILTILILFALIYIAIRSYRSITGKSGCSCSSQCKKKCNGCDSINWQEKLNSTQQDSKNTP